jgi:hypothetical protein
MSTMRFAFVNWAFENHGSAQDLYAYAEVAKSIGHEVVLYGPSHFAGPCASSKHITDADVVVFVFEFTTYLQFGDGLDLMRLVSRVPRGRRVVIDCDGGYNDALSADGDANHRDVETARQWKAVCDSLSDKICQPTLRPREPNVRPFFFHGYNPAWELPLDFAAKEYGMVYVGNNWFRWRPLQKVLRIIEGIRERVGRLGVVGHGWGSSDFWGGPVPMAEAYRTDPGYLKHLGVEVIPPVRFDQVVTWMSKGVFSPVVYRPLFDHLGLVTCRTFETAAASTIPIFGQPADVIAQTYGEEAAALALPDCQPEATLLDLLQRPQQYIGILERIRRYLREKHSFAVRFQELLRIVEA